VNADLIMIGDFYRTFGYPFIDVSNGGSLKGALEGLELTMKLAGPKHRLIPGHGTYINRTDIIPYRDMILGVRARVEQLIGQGKTLPEVLAAKVTAPYDAKVPVGCCRRGSRGRAPTGLSAWCTLKDAAGHCSCELTPQRDRERSRRGRDCSQPISCRRGVR
jgi:hypothetical protein